MFFTLVPSGAVGSVLARLLPAGFLYCAHPLAFKQYHSILIILSVIATRLKAEDVRTDFRKIETAVPNNRPSKKENRLILLLLLLLLLTAIGLLPGGSGYFTCIQNMKLVTSKFKSGGLHEKHVVATWNLGNHLSICL